MTVRKATGTPKHATYQRISYVSVASAAKTDDTLATLMALRDTLAAAIDECRSKRDLAALSRQLCAVVAQIENTPKPEPSLRNEIAAKRARRQAEAARRALVEGSDGR